MRLLFFASLSLQIELKLQLNRDSFQRGIEFLVLFSMITVVTFLLFVSFVSPLFAVSISFTQLRFFKIHILQCQLVQSISCLICVAFLPISLKNVTKDLPRGNSIPSYSYSSIPSVRLAHTTCLNSNKSVRQNNHLSFSTE